MQLTAKNASSATLIHYGIYTAVRLEAKNETQKLSAPIRAGIKSLKTKRNDTEDKGEDTSAALALRDEADNNADDAVMALSLELLSAVKNNRSDARYKKIFLSNPSAITSLPIPAELNALELLEQRLSADSKDDLYKKHLPLIKSARIALAQAHASLEGSMKAEKNSADIETISQSDLRETLTKTYGKLIDLFDKQTAEKYFRKLSKTAKKAAAATPPATK